MNLIYLLVFLLFAFATDEWQPFSLDKNVNVRLPVLPSEMTENLGLPSGAHAFVAQSGRDIYQLLGPLPISSALKIQDPKIRCKYYEGIVNGMVKNQGNILLSRRTFATVCGEGVEVTYQSPATQNARPMVLFSRTFIVNHSSYALTFLQADGDTTSGVARRRFFNSITVKP